MKHYLLHLLLVLFSSATSASQEPFRFHLFSEPHAIDPQVSNSVGGNYLGYNIYRGLYRVGDNGLLVKEGAQDCTKHGLVVRCTLTRQRWSNGHYITANDYVKSMRRLIDPNFKSPQSDVLFSVKNAKEIWSGKLSTEKLGVKALDNRTLVFELVANDYEFEYKLAHPALIPLPPGGFKSKEFSRETLYNGPYKVSDWKAGSWIKLENNPYYANGNTKRPPIEIVFIDEDSTALRLYETGKLSFLRRLVNSEIYRFKKSPEFYRFPMARFDYIGFGPELRGQADLRRKLVKGVDFKDFLHVFETISPPGCPSLPSRLFEKVKCQTFESQKSKLTQKFDFFFSQLGGDDIARTAEWFQAQWKKNAGFEIELKSQEQSVYLNLLKTKPPTIFRKGVSLERPTCLAALEIFTKGHPENFIQFDDDDYEKKVKVVREAPTNESRKQACSEALTRLLDSNQIIPMGEMFFSILAKPSFKGWTLNELNQLDLSQLTRQ